MDTLAPEHAPPQTLAGRFRTAYRLPDGIGVDLPPRPRYRPADAVRRLPRTGEPCRRLSRVLGKALIHCTAVLRAPGHPVRVRPRPGHFVDAGDCRPSRLCPRPSRSPL